MNLGRAFVIICLILISKELCSLVDYQSAGYNDADNNACYDADYLRSDGVNLCQMHLEETKSPKERSIIFRNQDMEATGSVPYGEIYGYTILPPAIRIIPFSAESDTRGNTSACI